MSSIVKPVITERSIKEAEKNKFTFLVLKTADKRVIKKEVEDRFKVNVKGISTNIIKGRKKRSGTKRIEIEEQVFKKAVIKLETGQKIDFFDVGHQ